jgi:hypothetical protein
VKVEGSITSSRAEQASLAAYLRRSSSIIAIDPGYSKKSGGCALAYFHEGVLRRTWFARKGSPIFHPLALDVVVWEAAQVDGRTTVAGIETVRRLCEVGERMACRCARSTEAKIKRVKPSRWKGSEPKPLHHARMLRWLSDAELSIIGGRTSVTEVVRAAVENGAKRRWGIPGADCYDPKDTRHNTYDAVALGLWFLGRLPKK